MIKLTELTEEESLKAIERGEFSEEILNSAERVIVILTQSWCPDWIAQRSVFAFLAGWDNLKVYYLEYDRKDFGQKFMIFKESVFRNGEIPYLRFYRGGQFESDSNYSGRRAITAWMEDRS